MDVNKDKEYLANLAAKLMNRASSPKVVDGKSSSPSSAKKKLVMQQPPTSNPTPPTPSQLPPAFKVNFPITVKTNREGVPTVQNLNGLQHNINEPTQVAKKPLHHARSLGLLQLNSALTLPAGDDDRMTKKLKTVIPAENVASSSKPRAELDVATAKVHLSGLIKPLVPQTIVQDLRQGYNTNTVSTPIFTRSTVVQGPNEKTPSQELSSAFSFEPEATKKPKATDNVALELIDKLANTVTHHQKIFVGIQNSIAQLQKTDSSMMREYFDLSRQLSCIVDSQEKRKYVGTDNAKTPFEVVVNSGTGKVKVQVDATKSIADLIRRTRLALNMMPSDTPNPRVMFQGQTVGHGMTLGEVGILPNTMVQFTFGDEAEEVL